MSMISPLDRDPALVYAPLIPASFSLAQPVASNKLASMTMNTSTWVATYWHGPETGADALSVAKDQALLEQHGVMSTYSGEHAEKEKAGSHAFRCR